MLHRTGKQGLATAYVAGFRYALGRDFDRVFAMDADFSHDPRYLPALLATTGDADLVIGSRYVPGGRTPDWGLSRRLISGCGNVFARTLLRLPVQDCTAGFSGYGARTTAHSRREAEAAGPNRAYGRLHVRHGASRSGVTGDARARASS